MTDIATAVAASLGKLIDSGKIEAAIEAQVEKTIIEAVERQLSAYSNFGKELQEKIKAALNVDLDRVEGLRGYNAIVLDIIGRKLGPLLADIGAKQFEADLTRIFAPAPSEVKLSDLIEQFKDFLRNDYVPREKRKDRITVHAEPPQHGSWLVALDRKPDQLRYACEFAFMIRKDDGKLFGLRFASRCTDRGVFLGGYYGFEATLFQLHAGKTKLIMDVGAIDRSMTWGEECTCDD